MQHGGANGHVLSLQFGTQRRILQEHSSLLAQKLKYATTDLADSKQLVASLQSQKDQLGVETQQAQEFIASKYNARLTVAMCDLSDFKLHAQQQQGRLMDANIQLQQDHSRSEARTAELEASAAAANRQLEDLQNSTRALLQAWAAVMQALGIAWEQPTDADVPTFMMALQTAQQSALGRLSQVRSAIHVSQASRAADHQAFGVLVCCWMDAAAQCCNVGWLV